LGGFFFSSRRRHTRFSRDWSSDVCSSDLLRVAVTDSAGSQDSAEVAVSSVGISTTASPPSQSAACPTPISVAQSTPPPTNQTPQPTPTATTPPRSGGGGHFGWELLALLLFVRMRRA